MDKKQADLLIKRLTEIIKDTFIDKDDIDFLSLVLNKYSDFILINHKNKEEYKYKEERFRLNIPPENKLVLVSNNKMDWKLMVSTGETNINGDLICNNIHCISYMDREAFTYWRMLSRGSFDNIPYIDTTIEIDIRKGK